MSKQINKQYGNIVKVLLPIAALVLIYIISYCIGLPEILFGQYDNKGMLTNNVNGEFAKYLSLLVGGLCAIWGLYINNKRLKTTNKQIELQTEQVKKAIKQQLNVVAQIEIAQKQILIAEKVQINTRFKDASQLFASENTAAILSGIYALDQIATEIYESEDNSYKGYIKVIRDIFCAYVRENWRVNDHLTKSNTIRDTMKTLEISYTILGLIYADKKLYRDNISSNLVCLWIEKKFFMHNYFYDIFFSGSAFLDVSFLSVTFDNVNFTNSRFKNVSFQKCNFISVDFSYAIIGENTIFKDTLLEGYSIDEITQPGRSLELTKPKD